MLKRIIDCSYKEIREYLNKHFDIEVDMLLGAFGRPFQRNEHSWLLRIKYDFPKIFKKSFLNRKIEVE